MIIDIPLTNHYQPGFSLWIEIVHSLTENQDLITPMTLPASLGLTLRCIHEARGTFLRKR